MSFQQEMKEFGEAFNNTASVAGKIKDRWAKRGPGPGDLPEGPDFNNPRKIETTHPDTTKTDTTEPTETAPVENRAEAGNFIQQAYDYYRGKGLSHAAAAGAAGNLMQESGGDPRVFSGARTGDAGASYYAGQWNDGGGSKRLTNIRAFATERGRPGGKPTLQDQFDFVLEEGGMGERGMDSPYIDPQWAKAFPSFMKAGTVEEATQLFRDHFERPADPGDIAPRLKFASQAVDNGDYPAITSGGGGYTTTPEEDDTIPADDVGGDSGEEDTGSDESAADDTIPVPTVDLTLGPAPLVPWDETGQTVYAANGGVIPETMHFAGGGVSNPNNPSADAQGIDKYNPNRSYTQPLAATTGGAGQPRRINLAGSADWGKLPAGPTASQLAFRKAQTAPAPVAPAPVAPAAAPAAAAPTRSAYVIQPGHDTSGGRDLIWRYDPVAKKRVQVPKASYFVPIGASQNIAIPGLMRFEDGGAIPELDYASGGPVREVRESWHAGGSNPPGVKLIDPGTQYSAAKDPALFTKPRLKKGEPAAPKKKTEPKAEPKPKEKPQSLEEEMGDRDVKRPDQVPAIPEPDNGPATGDVVGTQPPSIPATGDVVGSQPPAIPATGDVVGTPPDRIPATGDVVGTQPPPVPATGDVVGTQPPAIPATGDVAPPPNSVKQALLDAEAELARGGDPKEIGDHLRLLGIDQAAWPMELQNAYLGFARGGAVRQSQHVGGNVPGVDLVDPGTPTDQGDGEEDKPDMEPTPGLMDSVARGLDSGIKFMTEHFGLRPSGGIPTPEDGGNSQAGARRFADGEGATTPEELIKVDDKVDPKRELREGDRQLARLAKTTEWYLGQGRGKEAAAAAGSLLQYGAGRFSKLGSMAEVAYQEYLQSQDPKDLENTVKILEQAYQMIPDGATMNVQIDQERGVLVATKTNPDGSEEYTDIRPEQLPDILKSVQDKSAYWNSVFSIADPAGYRQKQRLEAQQASKLETREYNAGKEKEKRTYTEKQGEKKYKRTRADKAADTAAAQEAAHKGRVETDEMTRERIREANKEKEKRLAIDYAKIGPLRQAANEAKAAIPADAEGEIDPEIQRPIDEAVSRLYDALPPGIDRDQKLIDMGFQPDDWSYVVTDPAAGGGGGDNLYRGDEPPPADQYPGATRDENGVWVSADGKPIRTR